MYTQDRLASPQPSQPWEKVSLDLYGGISSAAAKDATVAKLIQGYSSTAHNLQHSPKQQLQQVTPCSEILKIQMIIRDSENSDDYQRF